MLLMRSHLALLTALLTGCAPGSIDWRGAVEPLVRNNAETPIAYRARIVLSTGYLECEPIGLEDDWQLAEAQFLTALTYEGARHLYLDTLRVEPGEWPGRYPGSSSASLQSLFQVDDFGRVASGWFVSVDEAKADGEGGLVLEFEPTALSLGRFDEDAELTVDSWTEGESFSGAFTMPSISLAGTIRRATLCDVDSALMTVFRSCDPDAIEAAVNNALDEDEAIPDLATLCAGAASITP